MLPVSLYDSGKHFQVVVVQLFPLQVERVDAKGCLSVIIHMQGYIRIKPAKLAERFSELDDNTGIVLLDELLGKIQSKGRLASARSGDNHTVAGIHTLLACIPDILTQGNLIHPVMHIDALVVISVSAALQEKADCNGKRGEYQVFHRHAAYLSGNTGEVYPPQILVSGNIISELVDVQRFLY